MITSLLSSAVALLAQAAGSKPDPADTLNPFSMVFGGIFGLFLIVFGLLLFFATILMPLYVVAIHSKMAALRKDMHELLRYKRLEMGVSPKTAEEIKAESR